MALSLSRLLVALTALSLAPAMAHAAPKADPRATARTLADKGYEAFTAGRYQEAADAFRKAEELFHAPTLVFAIARADAKLGKLLEARALFHRVIDEKLPPSAPEEFRGAKGSAETALAELEPRLAQLTIHVAAASGQAFTVTLDDAVVAEAALDKPIDVDPGEHRLLVLPTKGQEARRTVTIVEGARDTLTVDLAPATVRRVVSLPPPPRKGSLAPGIALLGVGVAGLAVGGALGAMTLGRAGDIKSHCAGNVCPADQAGAASSAKTLGLVSTIGFVVGGVGAAAGVTLLVLRPGGKTAPSAALSVGPGYLGLQGDF